MATRSDEGRRDSLAVGGGREGLELVRSRSAPNFCALLCVNVSLLVGVACRQ